MRIVDLKTFLALPSGTVFMKYSPCYFSEFGIREEAFGEAGDFWYVDLTNPHFVGEKDSSDWSDIIEVVAAGEDAPPLDFDTVTRDGLYEADQLFAVYERADVEAMIARLQRTLDRG